MRGQLWIGIAGVLAVCLVGLLNTPIPEQVRRWVLGGVVLLIVLAIAIPIVPPLRRRTTSFNARRARITRIRRTWQKFQAKVEDSQWLLKADASRGLGRLLGAIRPVTDETNDHARLRREVLPSLASTIAAVDSLSTSIFVLSRQPYPGERSAQLIVEAAETILAIPQSSAIVPLLKDEARGGGPNKELVEEWLNSYGRLLEDYVKFAADANRSIGGTPVYRQYF